MEHYAAILNLEDADSYCLQQDELFDHEVQGTVSRSILLGHGQTEHAALTVALNTLQDNGMLKTYKCEFGADGILKSGSGREALRHLWLYDKKMERAQDFTLCPDIPVLWLFVASTIFQKKRQRNCPFLSAPCLTWTNKERWKHG